MHDVLGLQIDGLPCQSPVSKREGQAGAMRPLSQQEGKAVTSLQALSVRLVSIAIVLGGTAIFQR